MEPQPQHSNPKFINEDESGAILADQVFMRGSVSTIAMLRKSVIGALIHPGRDTNLPFIKAGQALGNVPRGCIEVAPACVHAKQTAVHQRLEELVAEVFPAAALGQMGPMGELRQVLPDQRQRGKRVRVGQTADTRGRATGMKKDWSSAVHWRRFRSLRITKRPVLGQIQGIV
jgi:hypothetical protein